MENVFLHSGPNYLIVFFAVFRIECVKIDQHLLLIERLYPAIEFP